MLHQTSDDLLEVFLLGRISVLLAALDSREESGVVIIVLVSGEKQMKEVWTEHKQGESQYLPGD